MSENQPPAFWRRTKVEEQTGLSRARIYDLMRQGKFPRSVDLGARSVAWVSTEILEWIDKTIAASRGTK